jgi:hypothetical protein
MANFEIRWTVEHWYRVEIEATDEAEAERKFWDGEFGNPKLYGTEVQESVDILPGIAISEESK